MRRVGPGSHVVAGMDGRDPEQSVGKFEHSLDAGEGIGIDRVHHRVGIQVVLRRKLSFDVDWRDVSSDAEDHPLSNVGEVEVEVELERVISIEVVVLEQLIAQPALGRGVAVVHAEEVGDLEAPIHVVGLVRVGLPLEDQNALGELEAVRNDVVDFGDIRVA